MVVIFSTILGQIYGICDISLTFLIQNIYYFINDSVSLFQKRYPSNIWYVNSMKLNSQPPFQVIFQMTSNAMLVSIYVFSL